MKKNDALFSKLRRFGKKTNDGKVPHRTLPERKNISSGVELNVFGGQVNIANDKGTVNAANVGKKSYSDTNQKDENSRIIYRAKFSNNKKEKYIENWNGRLFLHLDNDERPLTLSEVFIMPEGGYRIKLGRIKYSDKDTVGDLINKFIKCEKNSNMLITGVPGIGKSTITSWIANQYKDDDRCVILRFRDWDAVELRGGLLRAICNTLECWKKDLEDKVVVLDGFDEMKTLYIREKILNTFLNDIKDIENFKCIITSRPAYIDSSVFYNRIDISPFNMDTIGKFYMNITGVPLNGKIIDNNTLDVLGVPVILYMAIMSNIDITEKTSKPQLYNRIFAEEGGIFDRFCEYDSGSQILRNPQNIRKHLRFLRNIAFMMFENNDLQIKKMSVRFHG